MLATERIRSDRTPEIEVLAQDFHCPADFAERTGVAGAGDGGVKAAVADGVHGAGHRQQRPQACLHHTPADADDGQHCQQSGQAALPQDAAG
jgi:hypothetical protein